MNRRELEKKLSPITAELLKEKGYICLIDVFIGLGYLTNKDVESWRRKRIPHLEKVIHVNLAKIGTIINVVAENCRNGGLRESQTAYKSWGKGRKIDLQFSKSGAGHLEALYSTHWLRKNDLA
jgi:hypothetical protein